MAKDREQDLQEDRMGRSILLALAAAGAVGGPGRHEAQQASQPP